MNSTNLLQAALIKKAYSAYPTDPRQSAQRPVRINRATGLPMGYQPGDALPAGAPAWAQAAAQQHTSAVRGNQLPAQGGMTPMVVEEPRMAGEEARNAWHKSVADYHGAPTEGTPEAIAAGVRARSAASDQAAAENNRRLSQVNNQLDTSALRSLRIQNPQAAALRAAQIKAQYGYGAGTNTFAARNEIDPYSRQANQEAGVSMAPARPQARVAPQAYRMPVSRQAAPQPVAKPQFARFRR